MKKVFLDCGFHLGEGLAEFTNILGIDSSWEVHSFEPNPACNLERSFSFKLILHQAAVWIHNNGVLFNQEHNNASNSPKKGSTSHLDGWGSCVSDINSSHTYASQIHVPTVDFADWILQFKGCEVYCKMDIEGAEFAVLRRMLELGSISIIKEIWVEWHDVDLVNENEYTRNELSSTIANFCKINYWK